MGPASARSAGASQHLGVLTAAAEGGGVVAEIDEYEAVAERGRPSGGGGGGASRFSDNGGAVIQIARVQLVYWGNAWTGTPTPTADAFTDAVRTILAGPYTTGLEEYREIGRGHLVGSSVFGMSNPPTSFSDPDVANFVAARIADGTVVAPDQFNQNLYVVVMPQGVSSSGSFAGEHTYYTDSSGRRIRFAWLTNSGSLASLTTIFSHELVESCTDPEGSAILGVAGTCSQPGWCEIGDICSSTSLVDGVTVQSFWSDRAGACIVPDWPQESYPQTGVQWQDVLPAGQTASWFTFRWPEYLFVLWQVVPVTPVPGAPELSWKVQIERASGAYVTYWITVTNKTSRDVELQGRYCILGR
jgi:hypothetical protein